MQACNEKIHETLANSKLQLAVYAATGRLMDKCPEAVDGGVLPDYQELRTASTR
jgi:hypothetical protein